ncbi:hypothetical protein [Tsuneonella sp. HG222]
MTAHTPNLPALIAAMPGDRTRKPQTEFTRERQVLFLENLSVTGSVRSAAAAAGVSHQTAYRARRSQGAFRTAWDAAMVGARAHADAVLAARAIDGIEEQVFYHGEVVATRVRYSDRLLLAHLARLDRLVADPAIQAVADDWDAAMERFARGEDPAAGPEPAGAPDNSSPGPCNNRSMSSPESEDHAVRSDQWGAAWPHAYPPCGNCNGRCNGPEEEMGEGDCMWIDPRLFQMEDLRPAGVPTMLEQAGAAGVAPIAVEDAQLAAFIAGRAEWWLAMPEAGIADEADGAGEAAGDEDSDEDWTEEDPDEEECLDEGHSGAEGGAASWRVLP